ncbi:MAG: hypothetical protein ACK559_30145, partial [bacterium]
CRGPRQHQLAEGLLGEVVDAQCVVDGAAIRPGPTGLEHRGEQVDERELQPEGRAGHAEDRAGRRGRPGAGAERVDAEAGPRGQEERPVHDHPQDDVAGRQHEAGAG